MSSTAAAAAAAAAPLRAVILGFGTVGQGVFNILQQKGPELAARLGAPVDVVGVLVSDAGRAGRTLPANFNPSLLSDKPEEVLSAERGVDIVFEAMVGEEPAHTLAARAIAELRVKAFITANKVMFAKYGVELQGLAAAAAVSSSSAASSGGGGGGASEAVAAMLQGNNHHHHNNNTNNHMVTKIGYEACVAGGVPVIKTLQNMLLVQRVSKIEGILNGTTNFILTDMRLHAGKSFEDTLQEAKDKGYAEADPYNDVSGQDAFKKLMCLSTLAFGRQPDWGEFPVVGIESVTAEAVAAAEAEGKRYRHVACVERINVDEEGNEETEEEKNNNNNNNKQQQEGRGAGQKFRIVGGVRPEVVDASHPLYGVEGVNNAVAIHTDYLGAVTLSGPGAGMYPTASVMLEDLLCLLAPPASAAAAAAA